MPQLGLLATVPPSAWLLLGLSVTFLLAAIALVLWSRLPAIRLIFRPTLRARAKLLAQADRCLDTGDWQGARQCLQRIRDHGPLEDGWQRRLARYEGGCQHIACEQALRAGQFTVALDHYRAAADLLGLGPQEATRRIVEVMLAEVRRRASDEPASDRLPDLVAEIRRVQPNCAEALFWEGIGRLHHQSPDAAVASLQMAHDASGGTADTALYLGTILARRGKRRDALKHLSQAHKLAPFCPIVAWQLGSALLDAGGDVSLGIRALQKAVDASGLPRYLGDPLRLWQQTLPPDSWLANLARRAQFRCPLGLDLLDEALLSAQLSLAQAYEKAGQPAEAAPLYAAVAKVSDSLVSRRGLGLALARLDMYEDALPHLRFAYAMEKPQSPVTTGYLALCLARGGNKAQRASNITDGLKLLSTLGGRRNAEGTRLARELFAEARAAGVAIGKTELLELCNVFAADSSIDAAAALAYDQLAKDYPDAVTLDHAQLYCRAAQLHGSEGQADELLFDKAFGSRDATEKRFEAAEWNFDGLERLYLTRWVERNPGELPDAPGPEYGKRVLAQLLRESKQLQVNGRFDEARQSAQLAQRLSPTTPAVFDRLAELQYRTGDSTGAVALLTAWAERHPRDPRPLARQAAIEHQFGRYDTALSLIQQALPLARDGDRPKLAVQAARIALSAGRTKSALPFLEECLRLEPHHPQALACVAALQWQYGNFSALPALSTQLSQVQAEDPRFHYLAAACHYTSGRYAAALESAKQAADNAEGACDALHLQALTYLAMHQRPEAVRAAKDASERDGPAREHAWALRGLLAWQDGDAEAAHRAWSAVTPARREAWGIAPVLPTAAFLAGVQLARDGRFAHAAEWLRVAAESGVEHPLLGPARGHVLVQGGVRAASEGRGNEAALTHAASQLEAAFALGERSPAVIAWLARTLRKLGGLTDAERILTSYEGGDSFDILMQRGLLAVAEGQFGPAERAFAAACALSPASGEAVANLLQTRFALGQLDAACAMVPTSLEQLPKGSFRRAMGLLKQVWIDPPSRTTFNNLTADDEAKFLAWLQNVGRLDVVAPLVRQLAIARPKSAAWKTALLEVQLLEALEQLDRGDPSSARQLVGRVTQDLDRPSLRNLLGCLHALTQDYTAAVKLFQGALPSVGDDPLVQQNLALVRGWEGDAERASAHWKRFLDQVNTVPGPPGVGDYGRRVANAVRVQMAMAGG